MLVLNMHYNRNPSTLQLEISSNCNLGCPGCVRTLFSSIEKYDDPDVSVDIYNLKLETNPAIPKNEFLSFDVFTKLIDSDIIKNNVKRIEFIGTIDDPLAHPEFLDMVDYIVTNTNHLILIHTNASLRSPDYFTKLANLFAKNDIPHRIHFSIDGLEDTNHLYRRGSNWNKIIKNAQAFLDESKRLSNLDYAEDALWQWLIFPWNEHQTDQAKQLAKDMGFARFMSRPDRALAHVDLNKAIRRKHQIGWEELNSHQADKMDEYIHCKQQHMYFVDYKGCVWPCCFIGNRNYNGLHKEVHEIQDQRFEIYGENWNNLNYYTLDEIIESEFYKNDLVDSWKSKCHGTGPKDRIMRCTQTCSVSELKKRPLLGLVAEDIQ